MNSLIQCKNLTLQYDRHIAVQNVSFSVKPGDFLCIVGENGSGKSTLLKGLLGLLPPHDGQISYAPSLSRTAIGYVPQQSTVQRDFPATVWEIVLSGCLARRGKRPFAGRQPGTQAVFYDRRRAVPCWLRRSFRGHRVKLCAHGRCHARRSAVRIFAASHQRKQPHQIRCRHCAYFLLCLGHRRHRYIPHLRHGLGYL